MPLDVIFLLALIEYVLPFVFGLVIGSFLNVCIYRIPAGESIVYGASHCPHCMHKLRWYELIPVGSYLLQKGRCRSCGAKISPQYPLIELAGGMLWLVTFAALGLSWKAALYALLLCFLLVIAIIDARTMEIPDGLSIVVAALGVLALLLGDIPFYERLIGAIVVSVPLAVISFATAHMGENGGMGFGDVKLMAAAGLVLGWKAILLSAFLGILFAAITGIALRIKKGTEMPLAPFLAIGIAIAALWSEPMIAWYLRLVVLN